MFRYLLGIVGAPTLIMESLQVSRDFHALDGSGRFWSVGLLGLFYGLLFGIVMPKIVWSAYKKKQIWILLPGLGFTAIMIAKLGTVIWPVALACYLFFWIAARSSESFISGMQFRKNNPGGPRPV